MSCTLLEPVQPDIACIKCRMKGGLCTHCPRNSNLRVCCRLLTRVVDKHAHVVIHAQWLDRQNNLRQSTIDDYVIDS